MGIVRKQTSLNTLTLFLGTVIGALNTMFLFPVILSQEQYGLTRILVEVSIIAAQFATLGSPSVLLRFMPQFRTKKADSGGILNFVIGVCLMGFVLVSGLLIVGKNLVIQPYEKNAELFVQYYGLLFPLVVFTILNSVLTNYAKAVFKSTFQLFVKEVLLRLSQTVVLIVYYLHFINFNQFVYWFVAVHALTGVLIIAYLFRIKEFSLFQKRTKLSQKRKNIVQFLFYSIANFLTGIAGNLANRIDILMIGAMVGTLSGDNEGLKATGIYAFASYVVAIIEMPARALSNIAVSIVSKSWHNNDLKTIQSLYHKSAINQFVVGAFLYVLILVNIEYAVEVIKGISDHDYSLAKEIVIYLGLAKLIHVSAGINGNIIMTSKYYYVGTVLLVVLTITTFGLNYVMIQTKGVVGASIATMITLFVFNLLAFLFLQLKFKLQPYSRKFITVIVVAFMSYLVHYLPNSSFWMINLIYKSILVSIIYLPLIYFLKVSEDANIVAEKWLKKFGILK